MPKYDGHRIEHMTTWNRGWEETHREELRADEIRQWSCTLTKMFNTDAQNLPSKRLEELHKCIHKKYPEQVKTDLTNLKVFWTFRLLDCTNSKGFQPSEELEKITAPASLHVTFIDSTQRLTRSSAVFFGYLPNIINDCYCRRSSYSPSCISHRHLHISHLFWPSRCHGAQRSEQVVNTFCRWSSNAGPVSGCLVGWTI